MKIYAKYKVISLDKQTRASLTLLKNYKISSKMQVYSCNIIKWQKKQSSPPFIVPSPDVATWASYSPDSLAVNLPPLTLFVMLQLGLWLCQYLPHCFTRWLPGRFYPGGGRRDFSVFLIPFSISPISGNLPQSPCSFGNSGTSLRDSSEVQWDRWGSHNVWAHFSRPILYVSGFL